MSSGKSSHSPSIFYTLPRVASPPSNFPLVMSCRRVFFFHPCCRPPLLSLSLFPIHFLLPLTPTQGFSPPSSFMMMCMEAGEQGSGRNIIKPYNIPARLLYSFLSWHSPPYHHHNSSSNSNNISYFFGEDSSIHSIYFRKRETTTNMLTMMLMMMPHGESE